MPPEAKEKAGPDVQNKDRGKFNTTRRLAEWISLAISAVLILATATYLVVLGIRGHSDFVPLEVRVEATQIRTHNNRFIVPIQVRNAGQQTLRSLTCEVSAGQRGGEVESHEFTIDYLGIAARQTVYVYFDTDPRQLEITATPLTYQLE